MRAALLLLALGVVGLVLAQENTVLTTQGTLQGVIAPDARLFKGIPFAQSPIGDLRWADPEPGLSWSPTVFQAVNDPPMCPQNCSLPEGFCIAATSEDCLYLDVSTPRLTTASPSWPVMVFFAGGGYEFGSGMVPAYTPNYIVNSSSVVLVRVNYRLGALGFMATTAIAGNFGIKDQLVGLQWIQKNIAAFGGNPNQVTIFGESAGAISVGLHLVMKASQGLFHRAIMESNPLGLPMMPLSEAQDFGNKLAKALKCSDGADITCLRAASVDAIVNLQDTVNVIPDPFTTGVLNIALPHAPMIDGSLIVAQVLELVGAGVVDPSIPIIIGSNADESMIFVHEFLASISEIHNQHLDELEYFALLTAIFGLNVKDIVEMYGTNSENDTIPVLQLMTDYLFTCPSRRFLSLSNYSQSERWLYMFNHTLSFEGWGPYWYCQDYVCHGAELPFIYNSVVDVGFNFTTDEQALAIAMSAYWTNFASSSTANPNTGLPVPTQWPGWTVSGLQSMQFLTPAVQVDTALGSSNCDYWDKLGYGF